MAADGSRLNDSKVFVEFTRHIIADIGCSVRFFPTDGRLRVGVIPRDPRVLASPIPECMRMVGELIDPADKMTSFFAFRIFLDAVNNVEDQLPPQKICHTSRILGKFNTPEHGAFARAGIFYNLHDSSMDQDM